MPTEPIERGSTFVCGLDRRPSSGRTVLWIAPGSTGAAGLPEQWGTRGLGAIGGHHGPLGAVLEDHDGTLLVATDPLGTMPVFWARTDDGRLAVSTVIAELVDRDDVDDRIDYEGVVINSSRSLRGPGGLHRTNFRAVSLVPGGEATRILPDGRSRRERTWSPDQVDAPDERRSFEECVELLRTEIDAAVRRSIADEQHVGAHVSGGLDCTAVACRAHGIATEAGGGLIAGYSWAPDPSIVPRFVGDERQLLDDVVAHCGFPVRTLEQRDTDWWHRRDPNRYPASTHGAERHAVFQARDDGVSLLLSGWGGDELASFNGRGVWADLIRRGRIVDVARFQREQRSLSGTRSGPAVAARDLAAAVASAFPGVVDVLRHPVEAVRSRSEARERIAELRAFAPLLADLESEHRRRFAEARSARAYQLALLENGHLQQRIQAWHQVGHLAGVRYRYPLLDVGVVEAALSMPWWAWRHRGWSRAAYRAAVAPWVPESVAWNLRKLEPAFLFRPGSEPAGPDPVPRDAWDLDDPTYRAALALAAGPQRTRQGRRLAGPDDRVTARVDRAL